MNAPPGPTAAPSDAHSSRPASSASAQSQASSAPRPRRRRDGDRAGPPPRRDDAAATTTLKPAAWSRAVAAFGAPMAGVPEAMARLRALPLRQQLRIGARFLGSVALNGLSRMVQAVTVGVPRVDPAVQARLRQRVVALLEEEWRDLQEGIIPPGATAIPWREYLASLPALFADLPQVFRRVRAGRFDEFDGSAHLERYPRYFARNFHFQSEGYLGHTSAQLYDLQVELLFGGIADMMRRRAVRPVVEHVRAQGFGPERPARILDVACGTGHLLRMLGAALPHERYYGVDLSPHYLAYARRHLPRELDVSLVCENAERLPFPDAFFDVVTAIYLLHEIPSDARVRVLSELARVVRPGGLVVLADSLQLRDADGVEPVLLDFPERYHEPYYRGYIHEDLAARAADAGLEVSEAREAFLTKVVVARRPPPADLAVHDAPGGEPRGRSAQQASREASARPRANRRRR